MKLIHLGDLHIGKNFNEFSMIEDQRYILNEIIKRIESDNIDAVLLAGDIYDRSVPSEEAVKLFDEFLTKLSALGKKVFAISGNHDSDERLNYGSRLFESNGVYIAGRYDGDIRCIDIKDSFGDLHVWLMPYIKASRVAHFFPEEKIDTYDAAFRTALSKCDINTDERNIIVVHQYTASRGREEKPEFAGSETVMENIGTIDWIGADCFDDFDYVAMGHIHGGQAVGRETCRYSGSLLKYSLHEREINREKTIPVITIEEKGNVAVELISLQPLRDVRRIRGRLKDLIQSAVDTEDYIHAVLTDEETQFDAMARLREVYPHIMKLEYDNESTRALHASEEYLQTEGKSFHELVSDFFRLYKGVEPNEKEWEVIEAAARDAEVIE